MIRFIGTDDEIYVLNTLDRSSTDQIERINLADGSTSWTISEITALALPDPRNEIIGTTANEIFESQLGEDILIGGDGSDIYIFEAGDGQDIIDDNGINDTDVIQIIGYDIADITFTQDQFRLTDMLISFEGSTDSIRIVNGYTSSTSDNIERFDVLDETGLVIQSWSFAEVRALILQGQSA